MSHTQKIPAGRQEVHCHGGPADKQEVHCHGRPADKQEVHCHGRPADKQGVHCHGRPADKQGVHCHGRPAGGTGLASDRFKIRNAMSEYIHTPPYPKKRDYKRILFSVCLFRLMFMHNSVVSYVYILPLLHDLNEQ